MIANAKCPLCNKPPHACECGRELARQGVSWEISPHLRLVLELTSSLGDALRGGADKSATRVLLELLPGVTTTELRDSIPQIRMHAGQAWKHHEWTDPEDIAWRELRQRFAEVYSSGVGYVAIAKKVNSWVQECVQRGNTAIAKLILKACGFGPSRIVQALQTVEYWVRECGQQCNLVTPDDVKDALRKHA